MIRHDETSETSVIVLRHRLQSKTCVSFLALASITFTQFSKPSWLCGYKNPVLSLWARNLNSLSSLHTFHICCMCCHCSFVLPTFRQGNQFRRRILQLSSHHSDPCCDVHTSSLYSQGLLSTVTLICMTPVKFHLSSPIFSPVNCPFPSPQLSSSRTRAHVMN